MRRRDFIAGIGAAAWPLAVRAQQPMPVVGFIASGAPDGSTRYGASFRKGLRGRPMAAGSFQSASTGELQSAPGGSGDMIAPVFVTRQWPAKDSDTLEMSPNGAQLSANRSAPRYAITSPLVSNVCFSGCCSETT